MANLRYIWTHTKKANAFAIAVAGAFLVVGVANAVSSGLSEGLFHGGAALQLMGVFCTAIGLEQASRAAGRDPLYKRLVNWIRAFRTPESTRLVLPKGSSMTRSSATAKLTKQLPDYLPVRVEVIARDIESLRDDLTSLRETAASNQAELVKRIDQETARIGQHLEEMNNTIRELPVRGIKTEAIGVFWIGIGLVLNTLADPIAAWLT